MTKIQICFVIYKKKKKIFDDKNSDLFYYIYIYILKRFSKRKTSLIN